MNSCASFQAAVVASTIRTRSFSNSAGQLYLLIFLNGPPRRARNSVGCTLGPKSRTLASLQTKIRSNRLSEGKVTAMAGRPATIAPDGRLGAAALCRLGGGGTQTLPLGGFGGAWPLDRLY